MLVDIKEYLLWIVWDIVDLLCIYRVMHVMFHMPKKKPRKRIVLYLALYLVFILLQPLVRDSGYMAFIYIPYYLKAVPVIQECLKSASRIQLAVNVWMYEVMVKFIEESGLALLTKWYPNLMMDEEVSYFSMLGAYLFVSMFVFMATIFVEQLRKKRQVSLYFKSLSTKTYFFLSIAMYSILMLEGVIFRTPVLEGDVTLVMKDLCMLLDISFVCLVVALFSTSKKKNSMQKSSNLLAQQLENMTDYYEQMGRKNEELRQFKHDNRNLLLGLHSLLEQKQIEKALDYLENMESICQTTTNEFDTGNSIADAILTTKKNFASEHNIEMNFEGAIPKDTIENTDMCIFLANVLDNALEASQKVEKNRYIHMESKVVNKMWMITISNSVRENVEIKDNSIETSKEDKEMHGYGLLNIARVVEKYCGGLKLSCQNKKFVLKASFVEK